MNTKILILILLGGAGISTIGILSNDVNVDVQSFVVFDSVETFTGGFECACEDPNNSGVFSMDFCNVMYLDPPDNLIPDPESLGSIGNHLCTWETSGAEYGGLLNPDDEGCSAKFWLKYSDLTSADYLWPSGYHPDYTYSDIFMVDPAGVTYDQKAKGHDKDDDDSYDDSHDDSHDDDEYKGKGHDKDDDYTLLDALTKKGKSTHKKLLQESVSALLNAAHSKVNYPYSAHEVIMITQDANYGDHYLKTVQEFHKYNNAGGSSLCS